MFANIQVIPSFSINQRYKYSYSYFDTQFFSNNLTFSNIYIRLEICLCFRTTQFVTQELPLSWYSSVLLFLEFLTYFIEVPKFLLFIYFESFLTLLVQLQKSNEIAKEYLCIYVSNFYIVKVVWFIFKIQTTQRKHSKQYNLNH